MASLLGASHCLSPSLLSEICFFQGPQNSLSSPLTPKCESNSQNKLSFSSFPGWKISQSKLRLSSIPRCESSSQRKLRFSSTLKCESSCHNKLRLIAFSKWESSQNKFRFLSETSESKFGIPHVEAAPRRSVCANVASRERTVPELNEGIAKFYDSSSAVWENIWGEHMHHGYYTPNSPVDSGGHQAAQVRMIEESLAWAGVPDDDENRPKTVVDVGCGIGGSARHLARKYDAKVQGITLSPIQAQRATSLTSDQGLSDLVSFQVADALQQPFRDGEFDLVWSMESGEHMPDKRKFISELARVTAPNGRILIVTWCHRDLKQGETSLNPKEQELLRKICDAYYLPAWCSPSDYVKLAEELNLKDVKSADWSEFVTPFWPAIVVSALSLRGLIGLAKSGWTTIKGALAMGLMVRGYQQGLIKFVLISASKGS